MNTQLNTPSNKRRSEQGQALVLIILAIVGILGFAALAIDLGRMYAERRRAQNAVDAASLAWAYAASQLETGGIYNLSDVQNAVPAYTVLTENGYTHAPDKVTIQVHWPPVSGPYGPSSGLSLAEREEYYQVILHEKVDPIFAQFIFRGQQEFDVEAVARSQVAKAISSGDAIVARGEFACDGFITDGGVNVVITGGNIFSNSHSSGSNCESGSASGASTDINLDSGHSVNLAGNWESNENADITSPINPNVGPKEFPDVPEPYCDDLDVQTQSGSGGTLQPGRYYPAGSNKPAIDVKNADGQWTMAPGMYCLYGDLKVDGKLTGGVINANDGVLIVMKSGSVDIGSGSDVFLKRWSDFKDGKKQQWGGMLIYMSESNHGGIDLSGHSGTTYIGTIYAPGPRDPSSTAKCQIGGNPSGSGGSLILNYSGEIICYNVRFHGNAKININYREKQNYKVNPMTEQSQ